MSLEKSADAEKKQVAEDGDIIDPVKEKLLKKSKKYGWELGVVGNELCRVQLDCNGEVTHFRQMCQNYWIPTFIWSEGRLYQVQLVRDMKKVPAKAAKELDFMGWDTLEFEHGRWCECSDCVTTISRHRLVMDGIEARREEDAEKKQLEIETDEAVKRKVQREEISGLKVCMKAVRPAEEQTDHEPSQEEKKEEIIESDIEDDQESAGSSVEWLDATTSASENKFPDLAAYDDIPLPSFVAHPRVKSLPPVLFQSQSQTACEELFAALDDDMVSYNVGSPNARKVTSKSSVPLDSDDECSTSFFSYQKGTLRVNEPKLRNASASLSLGDWQAE